VKIGREERKGGGRSAEKRSRVGRAGEREGSGVDVRRRMLLLVLLFLLLLGFISPAHHRVESS
jgi:hypothetical protein